tara:strand:- start:1247 stop:4078 length:2832 start_codon:yes stop_codon:yes gene_type:complete
MVIAKDISITERRGVLDERTDHRTGDYGLICQNENGTYNPDMENYVYSPMIDIPEGEQVSVDFLFKGSILDSDDFPEVDYWNMQVSPDSGSTWFYCSNPYGDTTGTFPNYVFTDAPELWALFSTYYNEPIDLDNYAGISLQFRYWFHSDSDAPQGEGLFIDDISIDVDGSNVYFESFEDSTMAGWVSVDQTSTDPAWHQDTYGAYGGSGQSWWMGDPSIGPNGGYLDHWYQVLDTPPVQIPTGASTYTVIFDQKRAIENLCTGAQCPECEAGVVYDGWDAFNIRISADGGETWEILEDAFPAYNSSDTYSFGYEFNEGCGIPGWGGPETATPTWEMTEVDIPQAYNGLEVIIRFAFSADPGYATADNNDLTGVWVDNIDIAGVFTNDGEDGTGFESKSLVALGGDLWHIDFIGVPPVVPMPQNVVVLAEDGSVEVTWDSPPGGEPYSNQWVDYDDGTFENSIVLEEGGQGYLGTFFGMPYGVESVTAHSARVYASNAGTTTLAGFAVIGGNPQPTPLYEISINTEEESFTSEIVLDWEFQGSFVIALMVNSTIGLGIDYSGAPSTNSWSNLAGWSRWSDVTANNENVSDGEFGIQARITSVGGSAPTFNVYRDPGLDGSSYQLMFNGAGLSETSYSDNIVTNGTEYCYRIASVYDDPAGGSVVSEQTIPECGLPISATVYDIIYDDGTNEDNMPVGNGNYLANKYTPNGYPSDLYSASFYLPGSETGTVLVYVWDDDGDGGTPGTPLVQGFPLNLNQGWNEINFVNEGFSITIEDGGVFVGYQQLAVNFDMGIDWNNASFSSNSMLDFGIGLGWEALNNYSPGGVWMIQAQMDGESALDVVDGLNGQVPNRFALSQNYPNPFNPNTKIQFGIPQQAKVNLKIYNILGESVLSIVDGDILDAGFYNYNVSMKGLSSGMYFYRLTVVGKNGGQLFSEMKKMILMR